MFQPNLMVAARIDQNLRMQIIDIRNRFKLPSNNIEPHLTLVPPASIPNDFASKMLRFADIKKLGEARFHGFQVQYQGIERFELKDGTNIHLQVQACEELSTIHDWFLDRIQKLGVEFPADTYQAPYSPHISIGNVCHPDKQTQLVDYLNQQMWTTGSFIIRDVGIWIQDYTGGKWINTFPLSLRG